MIRKLLTTAVVLTAMTTIATAAGEVTFAYKFEPGKAQKYHLKINTDMKMMGMDAGQVADMTVTVACGSKKGDAYAMTLTFDKPPSGGGRVTVRYPIEFAPGEEEASKDGGKG